MEPIIFKPGVKVSVLLLPPLLDAPLEEESGSGSDHSEDTYSDPRRGGM